VLRSNRNTRVRMFRVLSWLNQSHGFFVRGALAAIAFVIVFMITFRSRLSYETASLFWHDKTKLGAHRVKWYLGHGWTARFMARTPLFDPTSGMDRATIQTLDKWLSRDSKRNRLARLYILARLMEEPSIQSEVLDEYERVANTLTPDIFSPTFKEKRKAHKHFCLEEAKAALTALRILPMRWYIISGTFLGSVREGTFLPHDYDVDIGIHSEDFSEKSFLETILKAENLTLVNTSEYSHMTKVGDILEGTSIPALYRLMHSSGIEIDVFIHYLDNNKRWHGSTKHRWDNTDFLLDKTAIAGMTVWGPADADRYLTENYGDWRTPVTSFDCSTGTPNVSFPHNLVAVAEHLRIAVLTPNTPEAETSRQILVQEGYVKGGGFALPWR